jgi:ketosteroid isomerase-like protein
MSTTSGFEDRLAIRELIDRWSDSVNEQDWAQLATCFIEDGVWGVGPPFNFTFRGNKTIVEHVSSKVSEQEYVMQVPHAVVVKLNGDTATARTTVQEFMRGRDGAGAQIWATYYDELVRTTEGWRFKCRKFRAAIFEANPVGGDFLRTFEKSI